MAEVQNMHDCMEAGGRAMHGTIAEEQISVGEMVLIEGEY